MMSLSGTRLRVYENIPFQSDYKHVRYFETSEQQTSFFNGRSPVYSANDFNFQKHDGNHVVKVPRSVESMRNVTYLSFTNANGKTIYCFVNTVDALNRGNTVLHVSLDVFQTYRFDMTFKPSYVLREHRSEMNGDRPVEFNLNEGLDYGKEYVTTRVDEISPIHADVKFLVVATKQPVHTEETADDISVIGGVQQALSYYFVPFSTPFSSNVAYSQNVQTKEETTVTLGAPHVFMDWLFTSPDAVNNVVSMYVSDYIGIDFTFTQGQLIQNPDSGSRIVGVNKDGLSNTGALALWVQNSQHFDVKEIVIENVFSGFDLETNGRLMNAPYSMLTIDDFKGSRLDINPVYLTGTNLTLVWRGAIGTDNKVSVSIKNANIGQALSNANRQLLSQETEILNINPQSLPVRADALSAFLQGNRNSVQNRRSQIAFDTVANTFNGFSQAVNAKVTGNPVGMISSIGSTVQGLGNSFYAIQGINAQMDDIRNMPPSIQSKGTDPYYDYGYGNKGVFVLWKRVRPEYRDILTDFFKLFGFKTNRLKTPNLVSRQHFNYIETENAGIFGEIPNEHLVHLRSIFDSGVTLWHTNDIGNYSLANGVRT